ncbi:hypothetical protein [Streptomyces sp. NRRL S-37]|uniref:hypothetical protein n=1 Tax=Streptomyces sp. NRRL S-37 TaxID=1463903 RepID=UPI0004CC61F1|nr:hypothetical protein [Streptomyces sp. NRRL S-37]
MNEVNPFRTPEEDASGAEGGGGRRPWLVAGVAAGVLVLSGAVVAAGRLLDGPDDAGPGDRLGKEAADVRWAEGITPEWMSEQLHLGIPATARSPQAAYKVTSRFDTGILTFTLTRAEAEAYLKQYPPEKKWLEPASAQTDAAPHYFAHFGLPEPETLKDGMRYGYVCPGSPKVTEEQDISEKYGLSDKQCVSVYVHEYTSQRTRIYIRDHFEPGVSPLPAPPSSTSKG